MQQSSAITVCKSGNCDFTNIQNAVLSASPGDRIKVASGVYTNPNMAIEGRFLTIDKEVSLLGGYVAGQWEVSDPEANPTVLDGEGLGPVLYAETAGITLTVAGMTLENGRDYGIYAYQTRLMLRNSTVMSTTSGTGVYLYNSAGSQISNSHILNNNSYGIYVYNSSDVVLSENVISGNGYGLALDYSNDRTMVTGNEIRNNSYYGIYMYWGNNDVTFRNNRIVGNGYQGFYIDYYNYNLTFQGNTIADNGGDGIYVPNYASNMRLENNLIVRNGGDGIEWGSSGEAVLLHNTIADNAIDANQGDSGLRVSYATVVLTNTILAGQPYGIRTLNTSANVQADHTLWYNNPSGNTAANGGVNIVTTHDISGNSHFVGGADAFAAYHLQADSPAIDAGIVTTLITDIDGQGRAPDIGADEYPYVLHLTPDYRTTTESNTTMTYTHTLRNSGGLTDTYTLAALSSRGWTVAVAPASVTLSSGASTVVTVTLTVPTGSAGQADTTTLTAHSTGQVSAQASVTEVTIVGMGVSLTANSSQGTIPGSIITYTHTLRNTGGAPDTFNLSLSSRRGWATLVNSSPMSLIK